jgi:hypothetical protein
MESPRGNPDPAEADERDEHDGREQAARVPEVAAGAGRGDLDIGSRIARHRARRPA